ncbi:MAG: phosphatidate cytidylyltransferase [Noviherbaspirillum sp.]|jgi:phosphatidate cytidylyltransferase|nr:phosphatidate cytidylyltransferase [Noviherbaspirillum sp.]MDB5795217.1 phosphatidate cytidylyltransferase [Noviherbaspirillum sp.]
MLRTRVITALVLLAVLVSVLFSGSWIFFVSVVAAFFAVTAWESFGLFKNRHPFIGAALWTVAFLAIVLSSNLSSATLLCAICVAIWVLRLAPALALGLPALDSLGNRLLNSIYGVALLGSFVAITVFFTRSPAYLLSILSIVWVADIGAYFAGKRFGKRKLAPSISPGKSWEGAIGGWLAVLLIGAGATLTPQLRDTFVARIQAGWGWGGLIAVLTLLSIASVVGDLFESQLKRRAGMKDSSNLLPGHGGVLDRIDALVPALPLALLFDYWLTR